MSAWTIHPDKAEQLARRLAAVGVREADLEESFVRSGGHGGQNVNKVATCVVLRHRPSGTLVKCQTTRQQGMNRFLARQLLAAKLEAERRARQGAERQRVEKLRRQNRKRSAGAKQRILADKAHRSQRKADRRFRPGE
jgi:protein subunit release factor B